MATELLPLASFADVIDRLLWEEQDLHTKSLGYFNNLRETHATLIFLKLLGVLSKIVREIDQSLEGLPLDLILAKLSLLGQEPANQTYSKPVYDYFVSTVLDSLSMKFQNLPLELSKLHTVTNQ